MQICQDDREMRAVGTPPTARRSSTRVVGRYRYMGTHTGSFLGYPATGNAFAMRSIDI